MICRLRTLAVIVTLLASCVGSARAQEANEEPVLINNESLAADAESGIQTSAESAPAESVPAESQATESPAPPAAVESDELPPEAAEVPLDDYMRRVYATADDAPEAGGDETALARLTADNGAVQYLWRAMSALCIVVALILLIFYAVRRFGRRVPIFAGAQLGTVLGKVHLSRSSALHFVRTGGRVLVVGVTNDSMSLVAEFDEGAFDATRGTGKDTPFNADNFLAQLQQSRKSIARKDEPEDEDVGDEEISALRGDIHRLQRYLREDSSERQD